MNFASKTAASSSTSRRASPPSIRAWGALRSAAPRRCCARSRARTSAGSGPRSRSRTGRGGCLRGPLARARPASPARAEKARFSSSPRIVLRLSRQCMMSGFRHFASRASEGLLRATRSRRRFATCCQRKSLINDGKRSTAYTGSVAAARALLDWSQERLAARCASRPLDRRDFEKGRRVPSFIQPPRNSSRARGQRNSSPKMAEVLACE